MRIQCFPKLLVAAMMAGTLLLSAGFSVHAQGIEWRTDLDSATAEATHTGRVMMVDVYTDWCEWCKVMDTKTYSNPDVIAQAQQFVALKLNPEKSRTGATYVQKFEVGGYPTILFVEGDGTLVSTVVGYRDATSFADVMTKTTEYREKIRTCFDEFKSGNYSSSRELVTMLMDLGRTSEARGLFGELRKAVFLEPSFQERTAFSIAQSLFGDNQYGSALQYLVIIEDFNSNSDTTWQAHLLHAIALFYTQGKPVGIAYLDMWSGEPNLSESWKSRYQETRGRMTAARDPAGR